MLVIDKMTPERVCFNKGQGDILPKNVWQKHWPIAGGDSWTVSRGFLRINVQKLLDCCATFQIFDAYGNEDFDLGKCLVRHGLLAHDFFGRLR